MIKHLLFLLSFISFTCFSQDYYRWQDEKGVVHYADKPPQFGIEAQLLTLPATNVLPNNYTIPTTPATPPTIAQALSAPKTPNTIKATRIQITSPVDQATIRSNQGIIPIEFKIDKPLGKDQEIQLFLDGKKQQIQQALKINLQNIDRGRHSLQAKLIENGKIISSSKEIAVFLHRSSKSMAN